ncbi:MAG: NAD(P)/FAD-dependent oxidoreductase [Planctomycetota bacterium]
MPSAIVIGGGPAGLTAAYELTKHGVKPVVLEKDNIVGGIARTESYKGYRFDMGGHRFFTKSVEVQEIWEEVLVDDFLVRNRLSRIFYNGKFFMYPLKPLNALAGLGLIESTLIMASYFRWRLFPYKEEETFEQWVTNRFGKRLFLTFFKTYTEKVWGISTSELKAEWAAQRIKDLSLKTAILSMFVKPGTRVKTLIESFHYPRLGPGMLWEAVQDKVNEAGGEVKMESEAVAVHRDGFRVTGVTYQQGGETVRDEADHVITSMPLTELIRKMDPPAPQDVLDACDQLSYRDFLTVCVIVNKEELFPDNWIYIHDPNVVVGRIQNFKNWQPDLVPDLSKSSLGLEYFCNEGDDLWNTPDDELIALAKKELEQIGLAKASDIEDGVVYRVPKSYPVYDADYARHLDKIKGFIDQFENLKTIGRNGLHRYNNQDHSMLTGLYAVRSLLHGEEHDLWSVNADKSYHEQVSEKEQRQEAAKSQEVKKEQAREVVEQS